MHAAKLFERWPNVGISTKMLAAEREKERIEAVIHELAHHAVLFRNKNVPVTTRLGVVVADQFNSFTDPNAADRSEEAAMAVEILVYRELFPGALDERQLVHAAAWRRHRSAWERRARVRVAASKAKNRERAAIVIRWIKEVCA